MDYPEMIHGYRRISLGQETPPPRLVESFAKNTANIIARLFGISGPCLLQIYGKDMLNSSVDLFCFNLNL